MHFMILRKSDATTEAGVHAAQAAQALARYRAELDEAGILRGNFDMTPSGAGVRLQLAGERAQLEWGPFPTAEIVDSVFIIDVPSRQEAVEWVSRWPGANDPTTLEVRETGCPGGCAQVAPAPPLPEQAKQPRFAILLRSNAGLEAGAAVAQEKLDALDRSNRLASQAGVLISADGLQPSGRGARVTIANGKAVAVDGPFTEIKEMIAGYWLIRVASMDEAIAWARQNPYPSGPEVLVEIRPVRDEAAAVERAAA
jgi:hypothetical protein